MKVVVFYCKNEIQSIAGCAVAVSKYGGISTNTLTLKETSGLNEAAIDAVVASIDAASQHRIIITYPVAAGHVSGHLKDSQVITLNGKLYTSTVDPLSDNACQQLGDTSGSNLSCKRVWDLLFPNITPPKPIFILGTLGSDGTQLASWAMFNGTASAGNSTTLTDAGYTYGVDALIGYWVCIVSGTGINNYAKITDNSNTVITVASWINNINTGTAPDNTSVYRVVNSEERILADLRLTYYAYAYLNDLSDATVVANWNKLLAPFGDPSIRGFKSAPTNNDYFQECIDGGKIISDYVNRV